MDELQEQGDLNVVADTAAPDDEEDNGSYTLDEAVAALADDDDLTAESEAPEGEEGEADVAETITLSDGTAVTLDEVEKGFLREADYTRKTTELAEERKALESVKTDFAEQNIRLQTNLHEFAEFVLSVLPPEPDYALARSNPAAYLQQKTLREQALGELQKVMTVGDDLSAQVSQVSEAEMGRMKEAETAKLVKAMPALKDPNRLAKFHADNTAFAKEIGFTDAEIGETMDHRVHQLVHYARMGKIAEANRSNAQRRIAAAPAQKGAAPAPARVRTPQAEAVKAFHRNPTIANAAKLNFD